MTKNEALLFRLLGLILACVKHNASAKDQATIDRVLDETLTFLNDELWGENIND